MENQTLTQQTDEIVNALNIQLASTNESPSGESAPEVSDVSEETSDVASSVEIEVILEDVTSLTEPDQLVNGSSDQPNVDSTTDPMSDATDSESDLQLSDRMEDDSIKRESDRLSDQRTDFSQLVDPVSVSDAATDRITTSDTLLTIEPIATTDPVRIEPIQSDPAPQVDPLEGGRMSRGIRSYLEDPAAREGAKEVSLVMKDGSIKDFARSGGTDWDNSIFNRARDIESDEPVSIVDVARMLKDHKHDDHPGHRGHGKDAKDDSLEDRVEELVSAIGDLVDTLADVIESLTSANDVTGDTADDLANTLSDALDDELADSGIAGTSSSANDLLGDAIILVSNEAPETDPETGVASDVVLESDPVTDASLISLSDLFTDLTGSVTSIDPVLDTSDPVSESSGTQVDAVDDLLVTSILANDSNVITLAPVQEQVSAIV